MYIFNLPPRLVIHAGISMLLATQVIGQQWIGSSSSSGIIYRNGRVGINTTSPLADLHIGGSGLLRAGNLTIDNGYISLYNTASTSSQILLFENNIERARIRYLNGANRFELFAINAGPDQLVLLDNGNVGIGTSNPLADLHIGGSGLLRTGNLIIDNGHMSLYSTPANSPQILFYENNVERGRIRHRNGSDILEIFTTGAGANQLVLLQNGNVGIGTSNPTDKLEVAGFIHSLLGGVKYPDGSIQNTATDILTSQVTIGSLPQFPIPSPPGIAIPSGPLSSPAPFCIVMDLANTAGPSCGGATIPSTSLPVSSSGQLVISKSSRIFVFACAEFILGATQMTQEQIQLELVISNGTGPTIGFTSISPILQNSCVKLSGSSTNPSTSICISGYAVRSAGTYNIGLRCTSSTLSGGGNLWFVRGNLIALAVNE